MTRISPCAVAIFTLACALPVTADNGDRPASREATAATSSRSTPAAGNYLGYTGTPWSRDYGVTKGKCERAAVVSALAGPADAASEHGALAVLAGLEIDDADRACAAHALELARNHRTVAWRGTGKRYALTPSKDVVSGGLPCRRFALRSASGDKVKTLRALACQTRPGSWQLTGR